MLSAELKEQTRELHQATESGVGLMRRLQSADAYAALLARLYGFYAPLDDQLAKMPIRQELKIDLAERRKADWLRGDLLALGWSEQAVAEIPICSKLPAIENSAGAFGVLYVLEGSTLGGQFIRREVENRLGLTAASGISFFNSYGSNTGRMWNDFVAAVNAYGQMHPDRTAEVIDAAKATFVCFRDWVSQP